MDKNELVTEARKLLKIRIESLKKDVNVCLNGAAVFPALLYCFATIDLLGALYSGNADDNAPTTEQSKRCMKEVMLYPEEKTVLLQEIFRHKIVHLAQPRPKVTIKKDNYKNLSIHGSTYIWGYHHNNREIHFEIKPTEDQKEFYFWISIWSLVEDIEDSVFGPNGYLGRLNSDQDSQDNFKKAYNDIFEKP